jgi:hypothetical protein
MQVSNQKEFDHSLHTSQDSGIRRDRERVRSRGPTDYLIKRSCCSYRSQLLKELLQLGNVVR